jgi:antitoxin VapB
MQLNIKNPRTVELANTLARRTGETVTAAVTKAVEERLERIALASRFTPEERERRIAAVLALGEETRRWHEENGVPMLSNEESDRLIYDEDGLPR